MNRRIRVLFTISNFNTAGSGKVVYDLARHLDKTKFDIEIACEDEKGDFFKTVESLGLPIRIYKTKTPYRPYYSLLHRVWKISRFYKKYDYDIIHSWQWSNDWTEALAAKFAGVKWIYTKKAMGFKSRHWKYKSQLADFIITINDEMWHYFPKKKMQRLIPLGLDTDYYSRDQFKTTSKNVYSDFRIITVANMVPVKGIEVLLKAVKELNDSSIKLTILGDKENDYGIEMENLSESLGIKNQVTFIGKQLDVRPYLVESDLYVIPTLDEGRKEGMPMALVEAMSMGIPVIGSDITGINFVLKDFKNLLFTANDVESLVKKIKYFKEMDYETRRELGNQLREYCLAHFSLTNFIQSHEALYLEVVN